MRFFILALGFTLCLQAPAALATRGWLPMSPAPFMPLMALGAFGPILAAVICARRDPGGVRGLFARARIWRVSPIWYVVALFGLGATYVASRAVYGVFGGADAAWLYLPTTGERIAAFFMIPIIEETGWRGYALPRLLEKHSPTKASVILGVAWAAWHTMMFLAATSSPVAFAVYMANIFIGTFLFTWLFRHTQGSLLLAILGHMGAHLINPSLDARLTPMIVYNAGLLVAVAAVYVFDRGTMGTPRR